MTDIHSISDELHALRFKEAEEQRFIWWIYNVYSRNVNDLIYAIMGATTYDTEGEAKDGKYSLPKGCFDLLKRLDEYTEHIYDGTYLNNEMSMVVKSTKSFGDEVMKIIGDALSGDCKKYIHYDMQGKKYTKWGIVEKDIRSLFEDNNPDYYNHDKTSPDNNKCHWIQEDDEEMRLWRTDCGEAFYFTEGTPTDNRMKYCCYCGKELLEENEA